MIDSRPLIIGNRPIVPGYSMVSISVEGGSCVHLTDSTEQLRRWIGRNLRVGPWAMPDRDWSLDPVQSRAPKPMPDIDIPDIWGTRKIIEQPSDEVHVSTVLDAGELKGFLFRVGSDAVQNYTPVEGVSDLMLSLINADLAVICDMPDDPPWRSAG